MPSCVRFPPLLTRALRLLLLGIATASSSSFSAATAGTPVGTALIDRLASTPTHKLWERLWHLNGRHSLFGHQNTLMSGVHWSNEPARSDPEEITGSHSAVLGWDLGELELGQPHLIDGVGVDELRRQVLHAHAAGGIITFSWHMTHPASGRSSWTRDRKVAELLPGGASHEKLKECLDAFVRFNESLADTRRPAAPIPVIFRPWHEHNGDWFWWGKDNATEAEFVALWRFTVEYLSDVKQQHNLLYAFSPDRSRIDLEHFETSYRYGYPGDAYVDILGLDNYWDLGHPANKSSEQSQRADFARSLEELGRLASRLGKLPALTECGQDTIPDPQFWTGRLLPGLLANADTRRVAYILVWRNAHRGTGQPQHFFAPYAGHPSAPDFVKFRQHPVIVFLDELVELTGQP